MQAIELLSANLLSPMVLAFVLGMIAVWVKSDLKFPEQLYTGLSIFLLLAIGMKGGHELRSATLSTIVGPVAATLAAGLVIPSIAYIVLRRIGKFDVNNAAALAAHYGSVSAVTFAAAITFVETRGINYEGFMPALVAILEVPAIVYSLLIARLQLRKTHSGAGQGWGAVIHEVLCGRSVVLLIGGLIIGYVSTDKNFDRVAPAFVNLFYGALVLFLLDMGIAAAKRLGEIRKAGVFLIIFAMLMPLASGTIGAYLGRWAGLSFGGNVIFAIMCASASYIAAPAAVRVALPDANPAYYLTASIGLTFPFNLTVGIPLLYALTSMIKQPM